MITKSKVNVFCLQPPVGSKIDFIHMIMNRVLRLAKNPVITLFSNYTDRRKPNNIRKRLSHSRTAWYETKLHKKVRNTWHINRREVIPLSNMLTSLAEEFYNQRKVIWWFCNTTSTHTKLRGLIKNVSSK